MESSVAGANVLLLADTETVPLGMPPLPVTVPVYVTAEPTMAGLGDAETDVCVVACTTVSWKAAETLLPLLASPG